METLGEIVIISGPPGVGKTTACRELATSVPGTVAIAGDALRAFAPEDARDHLGGGSTYRAGAALARAYVTMGARRILFDYVFLRRSHVDYFRASLGDTPATVSMFTLWAPLAVVEQRERDRKTRSPLGDAVRECWEEIDRNRRDLGVFVNASEDPVSTIANALAASRPE